MEHATVAIILTPDKAFQSESVFRMTLLFYRLYYRAEFPYFHIFLTQHAFSIYRKKVILREFFF